MIIQEKMKELKGKRALAQSWFLDSEKRKISSNYDNRETPFTRCLSAETFISYYQLTFKKNPASILDIGCGQGQMLEYLSKQLPQADLTGIDSSEEAIHCANQLNLKANFICTDIKNFSSHAKSYDAILIHLCFGLFEDPLGLLEQLLPYLSNESIIYIVDLNRDSIESGLSSVENKEEELYLYDQYHASLTLSEFEQLLTYITQPRKDVKYKIGTSIIGGFSPFSMEFLSLIGNENLQHTLRQVPDEYSSSAQKTPLLLHAWLIKQSGYIHSI
ncbi:class I SAM-dependent methyltransferase [Bacillus safensis]|uniref:class I SAM-dependent methyltransferase n=1 Tax=Bacillus safensis TaxID=561879 RepID=UPI002E2E21DE|nr:class I SAM-dependent methyltransferase [Bacillus safensis]MED5225249.1 class I SAM-dependent methyltransferase [Bacillus safensis]